MPVLTGAFSDPFFLPAPTVELLLPNVKLPLQYAPSVAARPSAHRGERPSSRERPLAAYRKACYKEGARQGRSSAPLTGCEASSNQGIHAKMSPTTMTFGRDKSLRPFEKSQGFFQMGEGSWQSFEGLFPSPKNRTKYQYDANGNLVETIDANANANGGTGNVIVYTHNALNQQTGEYWYGSVTAAGTDSSRAQRRTSIVYGYDEDGELVTAQDNYASPNQGQDSGYHYTYNSLGQQLSVNNNAAGYSTTAGVPRVVLSSTYDADGNRKSLSAKIGSTPTPDFVNSYQYDSSNREVQVAQVQATGGDYVEGKLGKFTYDADGETSTIDRLRGALAWDGGRRGAHINMTPSAARPT